MRDQARSRAVPAGLARGELVEGIAIPIDRIELEGSLAFPTRAAGFLDHLAAARAKEAS